MSESEADWSVLTDVEQDMLHGLMAKAGMGGLGAMTDASKRRGPGLAESGPKRYTSSAGLTPMGSFDPPGTVLGRTPKGHEICLPEGVEDLAMWGRTLVMFGKYQARNVSYLDLVESSEIETAQYVKWCASRVDTAGGELKDFALFIHAIRAHRGTSGVASQLPLIPGSATVRQFK